MKRDFQWVERNFPKNNPKKQVCSYFNTFFPLRKHTIHILSEYGMDRFRPPYNNSWRFEEKRIVKNHINYYNYQQDNIFYYHMIFILSNGPE